MLHCVPVYQCNMLTSKGSPTASPKLVTSIIKIGTSSGCMGILPQARSPPNHTPSWSLNCPPATLSGTRRAEIVQEGDLSLPPQHQVRMGNKCWSSRGTQTLKMNLALLLACRRERVQGKGSALPNFIRGTWTSESTRGWFGAAGWGQSPDPPGVWPQLSPSSQVLSLSHERALLPTTAFI